MDEKNLEIIQSFVKTMKKLNWNIISYDEFIRYYELSNDSMNCDLLIDFINILLDSFVIINSTNEKNKIEELKQKLIALRNDIYLNVLSDSNYKLDLENMKNELTNSQKISYRKFLEDYNYLLMIKSINHNINLNKYSNILSKKSVVFDDDDEKRYYKKCMTKIKSYLKF